MLESIRTMKDTVDILPTEFHRCVGMRPPVADPMHRATIMSYTLITECLAGAGTPFGRMARNAFWLCEETEEVIYGDGYGFIDPPYVRGSRPILESFVASVIDDAMSEREKAMALSQALNSAKTRFGRVPVFLYGESDEQTLLKGAGHCSCKARLLTALCQTIGIQARPLMFWTVPDPEDHAKTLGGHTVAEAYVDGAWAFLDPEMHMFCPTPDGRLASVRDIRQSPDLLTRLSEQDLDELQPVFRERDGMPVLEYIAHLYFQPIVPTCFSRHDVNDDYVGKWTWATDEFREKQRHDLERYKVVLYELARNGELTDRIYAMGVEEFRSEMGITDAQLPVP
jgi:hypothetical protein